jgi:hypothetical protein
MNDAELGQGCFGAIDKRAPIGAVDSRSLMPIPPPFGGGCAAGCDGGVGRRHRLPRDLQGAMSAAFQSSQLALASAPLVGAFRFRSCWLSFADSFELCRASASIGARRNS